MFAFLIFLVVLCLVVIAVLWNRNLDLTRERYHHEASSDHWFNQCKAALSGADNLQNDLEKANRELDNCRFANKELRITSRVIKRQLSDEQEKCCQYIEQLHAVEAQLADANLRIEAAAENLANKPPQPLEQI